MISIEGGDEVPDIRRTLGQNMRLLRRTKGMTQEMLAEMVGVSGSYVGYLERGSKSPSLKLLAEVAEALGVDPSLLLTSPEEKNQELTKLMTLLSDKGPEPIKFMNQVATAYFESMQTYGLWPYQNIASFRTKPLE